MRAEHDVAIHDLSHVFAGARLDAILAVDLRDVVLHVGADVAIEVYTDPAGVAAAEDEVNALLGSSTPEIAPAPLPEWSSLD